MINHLNFSATQVEQWSKLEIAVELEAAYSNPYSFDEIHLQAKFTSPKGKVTIVDGFYMETFELVDAAVGETKKLNQAGFFIRFAPDTLGIWQLDTSLTTSKGTAHSKGHAFECLPITSAINQGFIQNSSSNYLQFSDQSSFIPIGLNMAWALGNPILDYQKWLSSLKENGGNFFRLWQCNWGLGLEWTGEKYDGAMRYQQLHAFYTDWLFDYCAEQGIYVSYCLQHHGQLSTEVNPSWQDNPYNAQHGGSCNSPILFFSNREAIQSTKNKFRYVLARWGYARSVAAWEVFNEVDWVDDYETQQEFVTEWLIEMAGVLKNHDPYKRPVTTSFAKHHYDPAVWSCPDIDFTQTHAYQETANLERTLVDSAQEYLDEFEKPVLIAEFGLSTAGNDLDELDADGVHLHNCLWATLFGGSMGSGLSWWWDSYIDPQNLYHHFRSIASVAKNINWVGEQFRPDSVTIQAPSADLSVIPDQGWGTPTDHVVQVNSDGAFFPLGHGVGKYLYGKGSNTEFRSPPIFEVKANTEIVFVLKTGSTSSGNAKIRIRLDDKLVLKQPGETNHFYRINVPAGHHKIGVENNGRDWISVETYLFEGLGKAIDVYALRNAENTKAIGYALNKAYNHQTLQGAESPAKITSSGISLQNMRPGNYEVIFFNCQDGSLASSLQLKTKRGDLSIDFPSFLRDVHFQVSLETTVVSTEEMVV